MTPDDAEILALKALTLLAQSKEDADRFLALSGLAPADLRARADDPEMLAAVMDFVLADDTRIAAFCDSFASSPKDLHAARRLLPGGQ